MSTDMAVMGLLGLFLFGAVGGCTVYVHTATQAEVKGVVITDKERITTSDSEGRASSKYLIFTENETFENTDSLLAGKFNSSDVYGKIRRGATCDFRVVGYRMPFFSTYRNILEARCSGGTDVRAD